mmetsp:Transcript_26781/g.75439  ORF Transcript_26781/g.75439 Transcript_26781/m.75439 type:complete len:207 (+) Transcript_26781:239-859(+)
MSQCRWLLDLGDDHGATGDANCERRDEPCVCSSAPRRRPAASGLACRCLAQAGECVAKGSVANSTSSGAATSFDWAAAQPPMSNETPPGASPGVAVSFADEAVTSSLSISRNRFCFQACSCASSSLAAAAVGTRLRCRRQTSNSTKPRQPSTTAVRAMRPANLTNPSSPYHFKELMSSVTEKMPKNASRPQKKPWAARAEPSAPSR